MAVRRLARPSWEQTGLPCGGARIAYGNQFTLDLPVAAYLALCITVQHTPVLLGTTAKGRALWWFDGHLWTGAPTDGASEVKSAAQRHASPNNPLLEMASEQSRTSHHEVMARAAQAAKHEAAMWDAALGISMKAANQALSFIATNTVTSTHSRHIPQDVKIRVSLRDRGMCRHVGCLRTTNLHFDHVIAYSKGGPSDQDWNIQLLCDQHNWRKGKGM